MSKAILPYPETEIQEFFGALYSPKPPGWLVIWTRQDKLSRWYKAGNLKEIAVKCHELSPAYDVYFGLGLQGQKQGSNQRGRADDVIAIPGLWLDIDCQGGAHSSQDLPTEDEARTLLAEFPLPPSIIVHSGGGLHAYWLFSKFWVINGEADRKQAAALVEEFQRGFIALAASHGWKLDNTSDLARVLRVPGTCNHKSGQPVPVRVLELEPARRYGYKEIHSAINDLAAKVLWREQKAAGQVTAPDEDKPAAAIILERCTFLRNCRDDADRLPEPEWYVMLTVIARTDGGPELCHELSRPYPGYSERETDAKIKHALEDTGPMTCERIKADFPGWCQDCREKVASPIVLGLQARWEPPIPFSEYDLPQFPTGILPGWLRDYVEAEARATQTPLDLAGMLSLSACAAAVAKKIVIQIRPGWVEPLNIWTVTALDPGNRKSAVFADIAYPIEEFEQVERERIAPKIEEMKNRRKILEQSLTQAQNEAAKAKGSKQEELIKGAGDITRQLAGVDIPVIPELIADDCSPEAVARLLADQGGRIAIMSPEGDIFDIMAGRYGNGGVNIGNFLKGHAGDNIRVKRINRPPEYVKNPALTMGLAVQPDVLRGLIEKPGFRGRGLLGRFLYSIPVSPVGYRNTRPPGMPPNVRDTYCRGVQALLSLPWGTDSEGRPTAHVLRLSHDAEARFNEFEAWIEPQLRPYADLGSMTDWAGKLAGTVARISGILHMAGHVGTPAPWSIPITIEAVDGAILLARDYLIPHAKAAFAEMGADADIEAARYLLDCIEKKSMDKFTKQEIWQGTKGKFQRVIQLDSALSVLIERGYLKAVSSPDRPGPGRKPAPAYLVNPFAISYNSYNPYNSQPENNSRDFRNFRELTIAPIEECGDGFVDLHSIDLS